MSLVTINNNVNINTNLFKEHEVMYPDSFVKCVKAGATWLATHSNISYQTAVMMRTDNMLYANSGSELIRIGLIDVDRPLSGLTFYDIIKVEETRDTATNNIIFRIKAKYKTPLGIELLLIPIAYFNPDQIKQEGAPMPEINNKPTISYPKNDVPVTNDSGSNNSNTQQEYYPADKLVTKDDLSVILNKLITKDDLELVIAKLRDELKANISTGVTDETVGQIMTEIALVQETVSHIENDVYSQLELKVGVNDFQQLEQSVDQRLKALEAAASTPKPDPVTPPEGNNNQGGQTTTKPEENKDPAKPVENSITIDPANVDLTAGTPVELGITTTGKKADELALKLVGLEDKIKAEFKDLNEFTGKVIVSLADGITDAIPETKVTVQSGGGSVKSNEITVVRTVAKS